MISIRLDPSVFAPGGPFHNVPPNRAVLMCGDSSWRTYSGRSRAVYPRSESSLYQPTQYAMNINAYPLQFENTNFQYMMLAFSSYSGQLVDFLARGLVIIEQDGVPLTVPQIRDYAATP